MKEILSKIIFVVFDIISIALSIIIAYELRKYIEFFGELQTLPIIDYLILVPIYIILIGIFTYEGIYARRYDFWHESKLVLKGLLFGFIIMMAYLALSKTIDNYSRTIIVLSFLVMVFIIPFLKRITKYTLYKIGIWRKPVKIYGNDNFLKKEILSNFYLGYVLADDKPKTVFINSQKQDIKELEKLIAKELKNHHEVNFTPLINDFDLTQSYIYALFNTGTNLIVFHNRLKSRYRQFMQLLFNYILTLILFPPVLFLICIIAVFIKYESPGPVFFIQKRVGKGGKTIKIIKFRSMYNDAQERLEKLLKENIELRREWENNFKLKNDPRVTKVGKFLRKTSLDELPQIFNVLKGDMNLVGPRPVVLQEINLYYKEDAEYYYMVKPGITGLWQVSGRSDTDYRLRVKLDKWYVLNWSMWVDIVILIKTLRVVIKQEGAY